MLQVVHVAIYLQKLILEHAPKKKQNSRRRRFMPQSLKYSMCFGNNVWRLWHLRQLRWRYMWHSDNDEDTYNRGSQLRERILDISQDLTYGVSNGKIIPPKQYSLRLAAHQISGRNVRLVNLLHNAGLTILLAVLKSGYSFIWKDNGTYGRYNWCSSSS